MKEKFKKLAEKFRLAELWEYLSDTDVFAVKLDNGSIAYCCVMGNSGAYKGLGVFIGNSGYRTYLDSVAADLSGDHKLQFERIALFDDIQLSFSPEGRADLWCQHPHMVPEPENCNDEETDIMCQALEACLRLSDYIKAADGDVVAVGFDEYEEYPTREGGKETLLMCRDGNGYTCSKTALPAYDTSYEEILTSWAMKGIHSDLCMSAVMPLMGIRKSGTLECRLIHYPMAVKDEGDDRGYFAQLLLAVTKGSGLITEPSMTKLNGEDGARHIFMNLCEQIHDMGHCPLQISVPDMATQYFLQPFCSILKIKLVLERRPLRNLNAAWESLFADCEAQK